MTKEVNIFNLRKQPHDVDDQTFEVNLIENLTSDRSHILHTYCHIFMLVI